MKCNYCTERAITAVCVTRTCTYPTPKGTASYARAVILRACDLHRLALAQEAAGAKP